MLLLLLLLLLPAGVSARVARVTRVAFLQVVEEIVSTCVCVCVWVCLCVSVCMVMWWVLRHFNASTFNTSLPPRDSVSIVSCSSCPVFFSSLHTHTQNVLSSVHNKFSGFLLLLLLMLCNLYMKLLTAAAGRTSPWRIIHTCLRFRVLAFFLNFIRLGN